jgi:hypothetical protein
VKVELKQEAPLPDVKVEVPEVKVEVRTSHLHLPTASSNQPRSKEGEDGGDPTDIITVTTTARALEGQVRRPYDVPAPR